MTNTLETLAERIEREAGPDRELDLAIAVALNRDDIFEGNYILDSAIGRRLTYAELIA